VSGTLALKQPSQSWGASALEGKQVLAPWPAFPLLSLLASQVLTLSVPVLQCLPLQQDLPLHLPPACSWGESGALQARLVMSLYG
jgi:hypothetical protein